MEKIITIRSQKPGKTITIMGGVHGNEICGVEVIKELREKLKIKCGTVYLIFGNPKAIEKNIRQTDMNLNRAFREEGDLTESQKQSYEYKRAKEIMPYLAKSDAVLDLHSSGTKASPPFIICESNSYEIVKYFPFTRVTFGWDSLEPGGTTDAYVDKQGGKGISGWDSLEPGGTTDEYVDKQGGKGICVECGYHTEPKAIDTARKTAQIFLKVMGIIDGGKNLSINNKQEFIQMTNIYMTKQNFKPVCKFDDFAKLKTNELIGIDGTTKLFAKKDSYILFARERKKAGEEAYLLGVNKRKEML